jgi:hypothetical protein
MQHKQLPQRFEGNKFVARPSAAARPYKLKGFWFPLGRVPGEFAIYDKQIPSASAQRSASFMTHAE